MSVVGRWIKPVVVAALVALAVIAVFHMQLSAANYDPQYMRVLVERTIRLGGSYYENGIHNKGPLEPAVYELAGRIGGRSGFWFVIAIFTLATSLVIGVAAAIAVERSGGTRVVGFAVAVMAVTHLTLSDADYAGVLYFAQHHRRPAGAGVHRRCVGRRVAFEPAPDRGGARRRAGDRVGGADPVVGVLHGSSRAGVGGLDATA